MPDSNTIGKEAGKFEGASAIGLTGSTVMGANGKEYVSLGHDPNRNSFFELKIPLSHLGNPDLNTRTIGIFVGQGDGDMQSGVDCIPSDPAVTNTPGVEPWNSPKEWADVDIFTVPFVKVGTEGGGASNTYQSQINTANYSDGSRVISATAIASGTGGSKTSSETVTFANQSQPPAAPTGVSAPPANTLIAVN